jgi:hypothetical protein
MRPALRRRPSCRRRRLRGAAWGWRQPARPFRGRCQFRADRARQAAPAHPRARARAAGRAAARAGADGRRQPARRHRRPSGRGATHLLDRRARPGGGEAQRAAPRGGPLTQLQAWLVETHAWLHAADTLLATRISDTGGRAPRRLAPASTASGRGTRRRAQRATRIGRGHGPWAKRQRPCHCLERRRDGPPRPWPRRRPRHPGGCRSPGDRACQALVQRQ